MLLAPLLPQALLSITAAQPTQLDRDLARGAGAGGLTGEIFEAGEGVQAPDLYGVVIAAAEQLAAGHREGQDGPCMVLQHSLTPGHVQLWPGQA